MSKSAERYAPPDIEGMRTVVKPYKPLIRFAAWLFMFVTLTFAWMGFWLLAGLILMAYLLSAALLAAWAARRVGSPGTELEFAL